MNNTTNNNNSKHNDKDIKANESRVRRSGRTPKPTEKVRDRVVGSPNGNRYGVRRVIRERRQPQYEKAIKNRRINLDLPIDASLYQLSREWLADNPNLFPDHILATPIDATIVKTYNRSMASIFQNPQVQPSEGDQKVNVEGLPIRAKRNHEEFDKVIRHEQLSLQEATVDLNNTAAEEEDEDLLMQHLDHFKKVKAWWRNTMEVRMAPSKQQIDPILASSAASDDGS